MEADCKESGCPVRGFCKKACGKIYHVLNCLACPVNLLIRLMLFNIFWKSSMAKLANWDSTLYLFANEYNVPVIPPQIAAYMSTAVELGGAVMLLLGLGTRFAALALLGLVAVIELTYTHAEEHIFWALLLLVLLTRGAGNISLDYLLCRKCRQDPK